MSKRPYEKIPLKRLEWLLGIGKAGLQSWNPKAPEYKKAQKAVAELEAEVALRKRSSVAGEQVD